jgi:hypothetical protein
MIELNEFIEEQGLTEAVRLMELWEWLKAENHYRPPKEELTRIPNREARRRAKNRK